MLAMRCGGVVSIGRNGGKRVMLATLFLLLSLTFYSQTKADTTLVHKWTFEASCQAPSTSLDGAINIVFDSATYVIGAIKFNKHTLPFHGRHLDRRLALRTDNGFNPVIRIDCTLDSLNTSLSG